MLWAVVFATVCRVRLDKRRRFCGVFFPNKCYVGLEAVSSRDGWMSTATFQPCGGGRRSLRSGSVLSEVAAGWAPPCPAFAFPAAAFPWREAEGSDIICPESIQEMVFLKSVLRRTELCQVLQA